MPRLQKKDEQQQRQSERRRQQERQQQSQPRRQSGYGNNFNRNQPPPEGYLGRSALPLTTAGNNGININMVNVNNPSVAVALLNRPSPTAAATMVSGPVINPYRLNRYQQQRQPQQRRPQQTPSQHQHQLVGIHHRHIDSNICSTGGGSGVDLLEVLMPTPIGPGATVTTSLSNVNNISVGVGGVNHNNNSRRGSGIGVMGRRGSSRSSSIRLKGPNNGIVSDNVDHNPTIAELADDTFNSDNGIGINMNMNMNENITASTQEKILPPSPPLGIGGQPSPSSLSDVGYAPDLLKGLSPTPLPPIMKMTAESDKKTNKIPKMHPLSSRISFPPSSTQSLKSDNDIDQSINSSSSSTATSEKPRVASKTLAGLSAMHKKHREQKKKKKKGSAKKKNGATTTATTTTTNTKATGGSSSDDLPENTAAAIPGLKKTPPPCSNDNNKHSVNEIGKNNDSDNRNSNIVNEKQHGNYKRQKNRKSDDIATTCISDGYNDEDGKVDPIEYDNYDLVDFKSGGGSSSSSNRKSGISRGSGRGRPRGRPTSRQNSNDDRRTNRARRLPQLNIVNDEEPKRLTNPLLAIVPASLRKIQNESNHVNGGIRLSTGGGVLIDAANAPNIVTTRANGKRAKEGNEGMDPSNVTGTIPVGEFMNSASLVYHRPDTYPLSFLARLLGFDVDVPDCNNMLSFMSNEQQQSRTEQQTDTNLSTSITKESSSQIKSVLPHFPTPLPDPQTLPLRKDVVFLKVPAEGNFFQQQQLQIRQKHRYKSKIPYTDGTSKPLFPGDLDDQRTLDYVDPVYKTFLQHGWENHRCKGYGGTGSKIPSKFILKQRQQQPIRQQVTVLAQNLLGLSPDWTFQDWGSFASQQEEIQQEKQSDLKRSEPDSRPVDTVYDNPSSSQQHRRPRRHNSRGRHHRGLVWTIDGKEVFSHLPQHIFGILACYQGQPVALLKYQLYWYQLPMLQKDSYQKQGTNDPLEAELVVVIDGIGLRTRDNDTSSSSSANASANDSEQSNIKYPPGNTSSSIPKATSTQVAYKDLPVDQEKSNQGEHHINGPETPPSVQNSAIDKKKISNDESVITLASVTSELNDTVKVVMLAMALEHTRACDIWYGLYDVPESFVERSETCFRMVKLPRNDDVAFEESNDNIRRSSQPMICDLKKCSSRYAILKMKERKYMTFAKDNSLKSVGRTTTASITKNNDFRVSSERLLVKMPSYEKARTFFEGSISSNTHSRHSKRGTDEDIANIFTGAVDQAREITLKLQAKIDTSNDYHVKFYKPNASGDYDGETLALPLCTPKVAQQTNITQTITNEGLLQGTNDEVSKISLNKNKNHSKPSISWDLLRCFPIKEEADQEVELESEILSELKKKQAELVDIEKCLEPQVRGLLGKTLEERIKYELPESIACREGEKRTLLEYKEVVARRKEFDQVCQDQLEEDMNAVCSICNDGEVTPDNQIIFCEACNVAVHQICYGVEKIPEGDYYCIACRYFKRGQIIQSNPDSCLKDAAAVPRPDLPPLPIVCEICPVKHGAFTQLDTPKSVLDDSFDTKWVHMTCAKWQGLNFVNIRDASLVEDVTLLKQFFRRDNISCCICKGMRGAYLKCRFEGCENYCHITCARESGMCEVVHGDTFDGTVPDNPWTLLCPDHSQIDNEEDKNLARVEQLIKAAKEFPVDPMPPPLLKDLKPFNKLNGEERKVALAIREYEDEFMEDILSKKFSGVRCEVCDTIEDVNGKNLCRCVDCGFVVCFGCELTDDPKQRSFQCHSCRFVAENSDELMKMNQERPECSLCNQKGGLLIKATSEPMLKQSFWKNNPSQYEKSLFTKAKWAHVMCAYWLPKMHPNPETYMVDLSNVIASNGKMFIQSNARCGLCGMKSGMKVKCTDGRCHAHGEKNKPYFFHVTCARQAGFRIAHNEDVHNEFTVHCYVHGSNDDNLRAKLEDLIEIEKKRGGKDFVRSDAPMTFSDGSKLLNGALSVMRVMGWAWRWAEWWVQYGSTWEPLLEEGQNEFLMTAKELRIVESSKESRMLDARRCRLSALGAALRNRCYDTPDGFKTEALHRALRAVLHTQSLVGPLKENEIDFFVEWLSRAYRSKSRLLGFGEDKILVANEAFCLHLDDQSPKFEIGNRCLPGNDCLPHGQIFESSVSELDDYLKYNKLENGNEINEESLFPDINYKYKGILPPRSDNGIPVAQAVIDTDSLSKNGTVLNLRRGRKPRAMIVTIVIKIAGAQFDPRSKFVNHSFSKIHKTQSRSKNGSDNDTLNEFSERTRKRPRSASNSKTKKNEGGKRQKRLGSEIRDYRSITNSEETGSITKYDSIGYGGLTASRVEFISFLGIKSTDEFMKTEYTELTTSFVKWRREKGLPDLRDGKSALNLLRKWKSDVKKHSGTQFDDASGKSTGNNKKLKRPKSSNGDPRRKNPVSLKRSRIQLDSVDTEKELKQHNNTDDDDDDVSDDDDDDAHKLKERNSSKRSILSAEEGKPNLLHAKSDETRNRPRRTIIRQKGSLKEEEDDLATTGSEKYGSDSAESEQNQMKRSKSARNVIKPSKRDESFLKKENNNDDAGPVEEKARPAQNPKKLIDKTTSLDDEVIEPDSGTGVDTTVTIGMRQPASATIAKHHTAEREISDSNHFLNAIPEVGIKFLGTLGIKSDVTFLGEETGELARKYSSFRKKMELPVIKVTGPLVSLWKRAVRDAAKENGNTELSVYNYNRGSKVKNDVTVKKLPPVQQEDGDIVDDDDFCTICQDGGTLMVCDGCEKSYHRNCLDPPLEKVPEGDWFCPECGEHENQAHVQIDDNDTCVICDGVGNLLICDGCEQSYHIHCLDPPLVKIPEGDWFCTHCNKKPAAISKSDESLEN